MPSWVPAWAFPISERTSRGVANPGYRLSGNVAVGTDVNGLVRRFHASDVVTKQENVAKPFVSRDHLVGRAFSVFWPIHIPRAYRGPTRVKIIR